MRSKTLSLWLGLGLALSACGSGTPTPDGLPPTVIITPGLTPTVRADTVPPTAGVTPTVTRVVGVETQGVQTPTTLPSLAPECENNLEFITDVTVPDGAQYLPTQGFIKKWGVRNVGTCDWGPEHRLVFLTGNPLGAQTEFALYPARAGAEATLEIPMTAPLEPGEYVGRWQARDPQGEVFGAVVFIKIEVVPLPDTPAP